jgi:hypothetical protein
MGHVRCATPTRQLCGHYRARPDNALGDRDRASAGVMSTRVRLLLVQHLGQSVLTLDAVATTLAVSRRTLTQRLAAENELFRQIVDDVRHDFARALLRCAFHAASASATSRSSVFGTRGVPPIVPPVDRSDATSVPES